VPDRGNIVDSSPGFGQITKADLRLIQALGTGHNQPTKIFTVDGNEPHPDIHEPNNPTVFTPQNRLPVVVSLGAYNALQGHDAHSYWELNPNTNWSFPTYEMFSTGGQVFDSNTMSIRDFYQNGFQYSPLGTGNDDLDLPNADSRIPGDGPLGNFIHNTSIRNKVQWGDNPRLPRDPDRTLDTCTDSTQAETRLRFVPSGLAQQILLDAFMRRDSFNPRQQDIVQRVYLAYTFEVSNFDMNNDGLIEFTEADVTVNPQLFLPPNAFEEIFVTREINDGLLPPRFFPIEQAYILRGPATFLSNVTCPSTSGTGGSTSN
jgi:hypothetical protein